MVSRHSCRKSNTHLAQHESHSVITLIINSVTVIITAKHMRMCAPDVVACCGAASAPDFGGGAMEGGGAGGLGKGPFLPLLTGTEAPMLKLVPAEGRHTCSRTSHLKADHGHTSVKYIQVVTRNDCTAFCICSA